MLFRSVSQSRYNCGSRQPDLRAPLNQGVGMELNDRLSLNDGVGFSATSVPINLIDNSAMNHERSGLNTPSILNIAGYQFVRLDELDQLKESLHQVASGLGLKGTILLSEEGINLFLAGLETHITWQLANCYLIVVLFDVFVLIG